MKLQILLLCSLVSTFAISALADNLPPRNPWVAQSSYAISHHNPGQTDSTPVDGPRVGKDLSHQDVQTVPVLWTSAPTYKHVGDDTIVIAANPLGIIKIRASGDDFTEISNVPYPGREDVHADVSQQDIIDIMDQIDHRRRNKQDIRLLVNAWWMYYKLNVNFRTMPSGAYSVIDKDGFHYTNFDMHNLVKSFDNNDVDAPLVPVKHANIVSQLPPEIAEQIDFILGITMTYDGHIVAAASGAVIVVDRELQVKDYVAFPGERVENSIAADEDGIYVVTSKNMHKLAWDGEKLSQQASDGAWTSAYNVMPEGEAIAMGAASHGSGTTPALMGFGDDEDKLVVISDGDPAGANIVAFWRDQIPADFKQKPGTLSRRIADQIRLPFAAKTTIEASLATHADGVIAINTTYPEPGPIPGDLVSNAFLAGTTRPAPLGAQKYQWLSDENRFVESWSIDDIDNTDWMPAGISTSNGLVYFANKRDDIYEYFAVDWQTGERVATWRFPDDSIKWNTWGGITVFLEDGDFLLGGFFTVKRFDTSELR